MFIARTVIKELILKSFVIFNKVDIPRTYVYLSKEYISAQNQGMRTSYDITV